MESNKNVHASFMKKKNLTCMVHWKEINVHGAWRKGGWTSINREREQGVGMYKSFVKKVLVFDGF